MTWPFVEQGPADGPPVILLHGMPGAARDVVPLAERLATKYRTVCPDFPGFGDNPRPLGGDASLRSRADLVMAFADSLGMRSVALVAHSMGGATALAAAAAYPARVWALVLVASVGLRRHRGLIVSPTFLRLLLPPARAIAPLGRLARIATCAAYKRHGLDREASVTVEQALWHLELFAKIDFAALRRSAAAVRCPTLVLYAEDDRLVAPDIGEELSSALRGARRVVLPKGGHRLPQKRAALITDAVLDTLGRGARGGFAA